MRWGSIAHALQNFPTEQVYHCRHWSFTWEFFTSGITVDFTKLWPQMFQTLLRSSKVHNEIISQTIVNYTFDWLLLLQGPIKDFVYKLACKNSDMNFQTCNELANFVWSNFKHLWSKFCDINCNTIYCNNTFNPSVGCNYAPLYPLSPQCLLLCFNSLSYVDCSQAGKDSQGCFWRS